MSVKTLFLPERLHDYLLECTLRETPVQRALRAATRKVPRSGMQISPEQGSLLQLLVRLTGARRCLEIGTYTGYSALAIALALPADGTLLCCDVSEEWTAIARRYWKRARIERKIELRLAPALMTLDALLARGSTGRFDFAFVDADKKNYRNYFERCLKLVRRGGLIAVDNTLWGGRVADRSARDEDTRAIRAFNRRLARDPRIAMAMVPIGDGLTLAMRL